RPRRRFACRRRRSAAAVRCRSRSAGGESRRGSYDETVLGAVCWLVFLISCAPHRVTRSEWQRMSRDEKTLYVRSLIGHEKAKEAKGGNDRVFAQPAETYMAKIDD